MKIRSTKALPYDADRLGIKRGIIEIDLTIVSRDDIRKTYTLKAVDSVILPEVETLSEVIPGATTLSNKLYIAEKLYIKSYEEYDTQKEFLKSLDSSGLIGSALEDKLLQDALLYSATTDTIYESEAVDWKAYTDAVIVIKIPVLDESDGKMISGEAEGNSTVILIIKQGTAVTEASVSTGPSGQFAYIPFPVLANGSKVSAKTTNITGMFSKMSEEIIIADSIEDSENTAPLTAPLTATE